MCANKKDAEAWMQSKVPLDPFWDNNEQSQHGCPHKSEKQF